VKLRTAAGPILASLALLATGCASAPSAGGWQKVGGPLRNVSGMALASHVVSPRGAATSQFLVVHDNKGPGEPRVGAVDVGRSVRYRPIPWPWGGEPPVDLEAVTAVPGTPGSFLALTSGGRLLHLRYGGGAIGVLHESQLPELTEAANLEAFAVQRLGGDTVALWADRGDGDTPAVLYWGLYDPVADVVTPQGKREVKVPFPAGSHTRHVSDLKLDPDGTVWGTAASDPGDSGPFEAAFYRLGTVSVDRGRARFAPLDAPRPLWTTRRKVEALELLPGEAGLVYFGADDESAGGWVYVGRRRPPQEQQQQP
jgi:hypothetical protein